MGVSTFTQPDITSQGGTAYKTAIDGSISVVKRLAAAFAPHQTATPAMTVTLDAGFIWNGTTLTTVAQQTTGTITAPAGNPRIDRVVIDNGTGAVSVVTGTPAGSPTAPAIPSGKSPVAQVLLQTSSTTITNSMITDERVSSSGGVFSQLITVNGTSTGPAKLVLGEDTDNGSNTSTIIAQASIGSDLTHTLPATSGTLLGTGDVVALANGGTGVTDGTSLIMPNVGYGVGHYGPFDTYFTTSIGAYTGGNIYMAPFVCGSPATFNNLNLQVTTAGTGNARVGIYNAGSNGQPGTLLLDGGEFSIASTGLKTIAINQALSRGIYWLAMLPSSNVSMYRIDSTSRTCNLIPMSTFTDTLKVSISGVQSYGALPSTPPTMNSNGIAFAPFMTLERT